MEFPYTELRHDHADLLEAAEALKTAVQERHTVNAMEILNAFLTIAQTHFRKEDEQLFSKVFGDSRLQNGGPFCTYYFGLFLDNRPLARVEKLMRSAPDQFALPAPEEWETKYMAAGSALAIPIEDHQAIRTLAFAMRALLQGAGAADWRWLGRACELLQEILKMNHEKEEHCLFPHIAQLLSV